uniref:RNA binding motif protein 34 n=1 Tax=Labrus bergylta TaxID=56723 RepID=A0A3Q3H1N8_9LABR
MFISVLSEEASPGQQSDDYVVGLVAGSLFQQSSAASGSSLSSLFSTAAPAASVLESSLLNADEEEHGQETSVKKKKRKAPEPGEENDVEKWVMKRQRKRDRKQEDAVKTKRTVFVGNLPVGCTKKVKRCSGRNSSHSLFLSPCSVREDPSISRKVAVIQRKVHPKKQSINAYVVLKTRRRGQDFHIRVDRVTDSSAHDHKRSVFVGNLSFEINELAVRRHFEECGAVEAVRLVRDQNSGLGKGFGYVLFESADSVQLALELDGTKLEGRSVRVKRSVKKEKLKKTDGKGTAVKAAKGPTKGLMKGPFKGPGRERGGFKNFSGNQQKSPRSSGSFKGEMTDPNKKIKKKKKVKPNKKVHI